MATASNRQPRAEIHFPPNTAVMVALKYNQGRRIAGQYGERMMFTTPDDRIFFTSLEVAGQIEAAGVNVREPFTLTMHWDGGKDSPRTWEVSRIAGEQRDGTMVVPKLPEAKPPATAASATPGARSSLVQEADALVDAYALVLERALRTYEGRIKPDEVRSLLLSAYIQRRQLSTVAA